MFNIVSRFGAKNFVFYWEKKYGHKNVFQGLKFTTLTMLIILKILTNRVNPKTLCQLLFDFMPLLENISKVENLSDLLKVKICN